MRTGTSVRSSKFIIKVGIKSCSLILFASWSLCSWKMVSSAATTFLKREITHAEISPTSGGSFQNFHWFQAFNSLGVFKLVCFTELYLKIFQIDRINVSTVCRSVHSLIKCIKHRTKL